MPNTSIDLGKMANDFVSVGINWLNKTIGGVNTNNTVKNSGGTNVGNVGNILPINLKWSTIAIIGGGIIATVFILKKTKVF